MEDYTILRNLFRNEQDEIHFDLFKGVNVIKLTNQNKNDDFDNGIVFNTASKLINYKNAYILLKIEVEISFDDTDLGKKSVPGLIYLKNSFELVKNLKIQLSNVNISDEVNVSIHAMIQYYIQIYQ